ncbi:MAG: hypothetical protein ACLFVT_08295 [Syntrophobacteria bacterium]
MKKLRQKLEAWAAAVALAEGGLWDKATDIMDEVKRKRPRKRDRKEERRERPRMRT